MVFMPFLIGPLLLLALIGLHRVESWLDGAVDSPDPNPVGHAVAPGVVGTEGAVSAP